jgi:hypothetical protein
MTMGVGPVIRQDFSLMTANALTGVRATLRRPVPAFQGRDLRPAGAARVAAFDGDLSLTSPVGGPTVLHVELPCA